MLKAILPMRNDNHGLGHFGAPRGNREHMGIDYAAPVGAEILATVSGTVTKIGYPYGSGVGGYGDPKEEYRYVEITGNSGLRHRYFYLRPLCHVGNLVSESVPIGVVQDLGHRYPGITPHCHYEVMDENDDYLDPDTV